MINGLLELLTTKKWMMQPEALDAFRHIIQQNLSGHIMLDNFEKRQPYRICQVLNGSDIETVRMDGVSGNDDSVPQEGRGAATAVLPVCGPITRNGDACSYGSVDLRDMVMELADEDDCNGIVFYINSPGGSAAAIADYKYAISYARAKGKKCVAFVDGMCASAAMYLAALCDERYYMNEQDQVGSIGTMAAFYTEKDGEKNQYTNETYHEIYADESYEKNKWHRDAANGEYDNLLADLNNTNEQFMADVKAACPNATDEHLHGKIFDARDINGILMDGQATLEEVICSFITMEDELIDEEKACKPKKCSDTENIQNSQINIDMNNYPKINAALGMEEGTLVVEENGTHMDASLLDKMEASLEEKAKLIADADTKMSEMEKTINEANEEIAKLQASLAEAIEQIAVAQNTTEEAQKLVVDSQKQFDEAKATFEEGLKLHKAEFEQELNTLKADLEGANAALATAQQTIADRDAQIAALTAAPAPAQPQGDTPANNGTEATAAAPRTDYPVWDGKESLIAFKQRRENWHKTHNL